MRAPSYRKEENTFQNRSLLSFESLRPPSSEADEEPSTGSSAAIESLFPSVDGTGLSAVPRDDVGRVTGDEGSTAAGPLDVLTASRAAARAAALTTTTGALFDAEGKVEEGGTGRVPSD